MSENIVEIYDISYEGAGVGRIDGQIVFVPKTLKNEKVRVKITKKTSTFMLGYASEIVLPSAKRIEPKCKYFDVCGGCDFQHCDVEEEKNIKLEIIRKELLKAGYQGEVDFIESDVRFSYRNKLKLDFQAGKLGFFMAKSREFFEIDRCEIASESINNALKTVKVFLANNNFKALKSVYFKQVGEMMGICFLFPKNSENAVKNIKKLDVFGDMSIYFAFGDVLESNSTKIFNVCGRSKLVKSFDDLEILIDMSSFNQVNDDVAEKLYQYIEKSCADKRIVNAYSGQGLLTYRLAKNSRFVYGIEYQIKAHESAERLCGNLKEYKVQNICGRVEDCLKGVLLKDCIDCIVLDPARVGCDKKVLEAIVEGKLKEVIYVSCNFATLVRDLKILSDFYSVETVKIFNMFPCCVNMETVAILRRKV